MEREPGIEREEAERADGPGDRDLTDLEAYLATLPIPPGIKHVDDDDWEEELAQAEADIAAGRVYPHSLVSAWLETWGKPGRKSFQEWLKSSG